MLTKDLLDFRIRTGKILPKFIPTTDDAALVAAEELIHIFRGAKGCRYGELEKATSEICEERPKSVLGLRKLLFDRCSVQADDGSIAAQRRELLLAAKELRATVAVDGIDLSIKDFQEELAQKAGLPFAKIKEGLYSDLPEQARIEEFDDIGAPELLARYNCALVQGLLLRAYSLTVSLAEGSLAQKRAVFRALKFHRLMAEVTEDETKLQIQISGPLAIFENSQSYGARLSNFFPHILHFPKWQMTADLSALTQNPGGRYTLTLNEKCGLKSHYQRRDSYIPQELSFFVDAFNERAWEWTAHLGEGYIDVGRQSYCFPDLTFTKKGKAGEVVKLHLEIFHKWHAGQLSGRLQALQQMPDNQVILGVCATLLNDVKIAKMVEMSPWFARHGMVFKDFPTPKAVISLLTRKL